jgi:hypothetical protein
MKKAELEKFEQWFDSGFLLSRNPCSTILNFQDKKEMQKQARTKEICLMMLRQKWKSEALRKEIALAFFVSMRTALDYLNYAKMVLEKYESGD